MGDGLWHTHIRHRRVTHLRHAQLQGPRGQARDVMQPWGALKDGRALGVEWDK